jgi:hypothetical protein
MRMKRNGVTRESELKEEPESAKHGGLRGESKKKKEKADFDLLTRPSMRMKRNEVTRESSLKGVRNRIKDRDIMIL